MSKYKVAVIEDNPTESFLLKMALASVSNIEVSLYENANSLIETFSDMADIFIVDINLPDMNGLDLINEILAKKKTSRIFVMSAQEDMSVVSKLQESNIANYVVKNKACLTYLKSSIDKEVSLLEAGYYS
ncbi:response regulator [Flavobacteriales bacterium]|nr:response regulator [Flavobacteriales bacterium]